MRSLIDLLEEQAARALVIAVGRPVVPEITSSAQPQFGHYQCNNALKLAKELKKDSQKVAQTIVDAWETPLEMIDKIEIGGAGFINIFLSKNFLSNQINLVLRDEHLGVPLPKHREKIIVEFSSPNIAKELHVGHLRSTIIGDCLARLFEFLGHTVLRLNHIGDWGTQFGMLIAYLKEEVPGILDGKNEADLNSLMSWYQASKERFDDDSAFKFRAQQEVVKLQRGDALSLLGWKIICDISRKAFQEIYDLLDIKLVERGESFYHPYLAKMISDLEKKQMITLSDGAKCIYLDGFIGREGEPLPLIIEKSDGGYNYNTTDLAAVRHRIEKEKASRIIIVTDLGQTLHFKMLFQAAEKVGYLDCKKVQINHVGFGVVLAPDGKKFKTRSGTTEKLIDLLLESMRQAKIILAKRLPQLTEKELDDRAKILGIDAVKYADLSSNRLKDYTFSYSRMLRFEGNTAPFLLYAYVRIQSIKKKIGKNLKSLLETGQIHLEDPSEVDLSLHLIQFGETLDTIVKDLLPHRLTEYLYLLAEKFHYFFHACQVKESPQETSRLLLCEVTGRILHQGLTILGLKTLEEM